MDHPKFIVSNQKKEFICTKRVNTGLTDIASTSISLGKNDILGYKWVVILFIYNCITNRHMYNKICLEDHSAEEYIGN